MTRHDMRGFRWGEAHGSDHSAHRFEKNLTVAFARRNRRSIPGRAREIMELADAGPKLFVHSRFRGDPKLDAVLNGRVFLRRGSRGRSVSTVQQALVDLGHDLPRFGVDGDFGSETRNAIMDFQRSVRRTNPGFAVDGIIGPNTMEQLDLAISRLRLRKNVTQLAPAERINFVNAINEFERRGMRTQFVIDHGLASNFAHGNSGFLPWHRQFIMNFESQLRSIDDRVSLPYWDWINDDGVDARGNPDWNAVMTSLVGGNGTGAPVSFQGDVIGRELLSGPVSHWRFIEENGRQTTTRLAREFNTRLVRLSGGRVSGLPIQATLDLANAIPVYDAPDFGRDPPNPSFRSALERTLHNLVHVWVGGQMGEVPVSPNDPAFFLHHCMVDKIWADWQVANPAATYLPPTRTANAPGLTDPMNVMNLDQPAPGTVTPAAAWDLSNQTDNFGNSRLRIRYV
ncbi:MAG: tyrosinase family protein [Rhizobiaceae bacterium]